MKECSKCKFVKFSVAEYPCIICDGNFSEFEECGNPYWEHIEILAHRQRKKGIETYGQGLEANTAAIEARLQHLQEELIDALMYCEWIKEYFEEREESNDTE